MKMKKFGFLAIFVVILAALSAGCASYGAKTGFPEFQPADGRLTKVSAGDYTISAFPLNKEEGKTYFDYDLGKERVAAVFVEVGGQPNGGDILSSVSLNFNNSAVLYPMNREEVYYSIRNEYWAKASLWYFAGYIGAPISALHTKSVNKKIEEDLNRKLLVSGSGLKDLRGFLMFKVPEGLVPKGSAVSGALKLVLKIGGKEAIYSLPLSPVKFPDPEPPAAPKLNE